MKIPQVTLETINAESTKIKGKVQNWQNWSKERKKKYYDNLIFHKEQPILAEWLIIASRLFNMNAGGVMAIIDATYQCIKVEMENQELEEMIK